MAIARKRRQKTTRPHRRAKPASKPSAPKTTRRGDYEAYKIRQAEVSRKRSATGRDIGPCRPPANPARRKRCEKSLRLFAEIYAAEQFGLEWSEDHLKAIARMEDCIRNGGLFALAMPRGSGKTTLSEIAAIWAVVYGYRSFVMLIAATAEKAVEILDRIRGFIESSDLLAEDFDEICKPILKLEGINNRAAGQTCEGLPTAITWGKKQIVFPTVKDSKASGAIIRVVGITGAIRGAKHLTKTGKPRRPDLALIDDASTEKSARSFGQNNTRERIVKRAILRLAGPGKSIAAFMLCTVIEAGDLADRFLDRKKNPDWRGERCRMLYEFPKNDALWEEYHVLRLQGLEDEDGGLAGNEFYKKNRKAMDEGCVPAWSARHEPNELSAVQHAMNLFLQDPEGFLAEFQNDPQPNVLGNGIKRLEAAAIAKRISGVERFVVPRECSVLTAMLDVSTHLLWYMIVGWNERFGGSIIDYGCWPPQSRSHFKQDDARPSLSHKYPGLGEEERIFAGLTDLTGEILGRRYRTQLVNADLQIERLLIDAGYKTDTIYQFVRQVQSNGTIVMPSMGRGRTQSQHGVSEWKPRKGELRGYCWRRTIPETGRGYMIQFEPDAWKSFVCERLIAPQGGRACLTLFGEKPHPQLHPLVSDHLSAEYGEPVTIRGKTFDKWNLVPPGDRDNHWLDCLVGAAVAGSVGGLAWTASDKARAAMNTAPKVITQDEINRAQRKRQTIKPQGLSA